ncbi:hypothetical protein GE09DRAFT_1114765 [Coniochaeta sp. 2T2.1]|nr:hypothetical protein GE09DRAFT_1114765 [Coniochaeta sp. 2T2.1]
MESPTSTSTSITQPEAAAITALTLLTSLLFLVSTLERTFISKRQHDDSSFASTRTLTWQHPLVWYYLWLFRGAMSIIACLLPLAPMWVELAFEQKFGFTGVAAAWATSALVACICSGIVGERLLYLSFTESLNLEQVTCTFLSIAGVVLLILGELTSVVPGPIAWSVTGAALHRFSMVLWWYIVTNRASTSPQFRGRTRITLAGHGVAFACVFLSFLPIFQDSLDRLFVSSTLLRIFSSCCSLFLLHYVVAPSPSCAESRS